MFRYEFIPSIYTSTLLINEYVNRMKRNEFLMNYEIIIKTARDKEFRMLLNNTRGFLSPTPAKDQS